MRTPTFLILIALLIPQATAAALPPDAGEGLSPGALRAELLAADGLTLAAGATVAFIAPDAVDTEARLGRGVATTWGLGMIAAPSIYWYNGFSKSGYASAGLRALGPVIGAGTGLIAYCIITEPPSRGGHETQCARRGAIGGAAAGVVGAIGIDLLVLPNLRRPERPERRWYGWQTALADAAGAAAGAALYLTAEDQTFENDAGTRTSVFGLTEWLGMWAIGGLGSPIIHMVHGEFLRALGAAGARYLGSLLVGVGGMVGYCSAVGAEKGCSLTGFFWGAFGGAVLVGAWDALQLAYEKVETEEPPVRIGLAPFSDGERHGLGLQGRW